MDQREINWALLFRTWRAAFGLTHRQAERVLGVGPGNIKRWEAGTLPRGPLRPRLLRIMGAGPPVKPPARRPGRRHVNNL